ncbi:Pyridoxamine 5'-phosphate oxidase [Roseovarius albus]|uniref:Pyridoxamine 5'-phosphate oxidase n=1 Tax=Roseovarius albus TaxID=1247867 RepID=A0A1X6ZMZ6_9RHOB|nr:pyridoxamine 5'-phosphate oxidase family protein [Roseovarius albus]SLN56467.1 Pyridoxamine 5'-phosphate oxidase [Roseovarius albus]
MSNAPTDRTRLRRMYERGHYDKDTLYSILDATPQCFVGYTIDGAPYVTPTFHWREGNHIYWHGSSASRALKSSNEAQVCVTVSLLDGFVLARSGMHHSANTRSVMLFGTAQKVTDPEEKEAKLCRFVDGLFPGRAASLRPNTTQELKATTILSLEINEASAKIRTGGPGDDEEDYALPIWAGVIPVKMVAGPVEPDPRNLPGVEVSDDVKNWRGIG